MSMDRREFLKAAGLSAVAGLGAKGAFDLFMPGDVDASEHEGHSEHGEGHGGVAEAGPKVRLAMAIDVLQLKDHSKVDKIRAACDNAHNIPHWDSKDDEIKWIWEDEYEHVFPDTHNEYLADEVRELPFLLMCNHCDDPPCARVCPVEATFKRPDGIVAQDYHRCIGCRFCMAACPYGSRSFNWFDPRIPLKAEGRKLNPRFPTRMRGVVEKCNFCVERLAEGKKPACVEACPDVMIFGNLADPNSNIRKVLRERVSLRRKLELGTKPSVFYLV